jgi:hypothetical protein
MNQEMLDTLEELAPGLAHVIEDMDMTEAELLELLQELEG